MRGKSLSYKPGAGENRDYWAIKKWLADKGITLTEIANIEPKIRTTTLSSTIRGIRNSREALRRFLAIGCPAKILSLPADMKVDQGAVDAGR